MEKSKLLCLGLCVFISQLALADGRSVRSFMGQATGQAHFNCAFQGKKASKPCLVKLSQELITHPTVRAFHDARRPVKVLSVYWPDGDVSRYVEIDSLELVNLAERSGTGYMIRTDEWPEVDWSRGYVIEKNSREWLRLW